MTKYKNIPVTQEIRDHLESRKVHPRETWNDIIIRLIQIHDLYNEAKNKEET